MTVAEVIGLIVILAVGIYVGLPILRARSAARGPRAGHRTAREDRLTELATRKEAALAAIKDIEFDHQMGKLSAEDFRALRDRYKAEAIALLKAIDELNGKNRPEPRPGSPSPEGLRGDRDDREEVPGTAERPRGSGRVDRQPQPAVAEASHPRFCAKCGQPVIRGDRFCSYCGFRL